MMNGRANQSGQDAGLEARLRTLRILWVVFLISIGLYALVPTFALKGRDAGAEGADNQTLVAAFAVLAFLAVAASFVLKRHFYAHAAEQSSPAKFQTGFVVAEVFCEFAALLGMVTLFITLDKAGYLLFVLGAFGQLLHFPRRDQLAAAYGKGF